MQLNKLHAFASRSGRTTQHIMSLQVYFDMMVIISIVAHESVSKSVSLIINFTDTKSSHLVERILFCWYLERITTHFLFPSGLSWNVLSDMYLTRIKRLDWNLVPDAQSFINTTCQNSFLSQALIMPLSVSSTLFPYRSPLSPSFVTHTLLIAINGIIRMMEIHCSRQPSLPPSLSLCLSGRAHYNHRLTEGIVMSSISLVGAGPAMWPCVMGLYWSHPVESYRA